MTYSELKEVAKQVTDILLANGKNISDLPIKYVLDGGDKILIDSNKVLSFIEFSQFNNLVKNYNHYSEEDLDTITEYGLYYIGPFSSSMTDGSKRQILLVTSNNFHTVEGFNVPIKHAIQEFTSINLDGTYNKKVRIGYGSRTSDGSEQWTWGEWEIKDKYSTYMVRNILSLTNYSTQDEIRSVFGIESPTNVDFFDEYISKGTTFVDYEESDNMYYQMTAYALNGNTMFECNDVIFNFNNTSDPISVSVYKKNQTNKLVLRNAGLADFNTGMTNAEIMNAFGLGSSSKFDDLLKYVKKYDFAKNSSEGLCGIYNINIQTSNEGKIVMSASAYDTGNLDPYTWVVQISKDASGNAIVEWVIAK